MTPKRVALVPIVDIAAFVVLTRLGVGMTEAHLLSIGLAAAVFYLILGRRDFDSVHGRMGLRAHGHFLVVVLFAASIQGAVLGLTAQVWGWNSFIAIIPAALAAIGVVLRGHALILRTPVWEIGGSSQCRPVVLALIVLAFALRLLYITQLELLPEDAYYWNYAQHMALGYLDHPPMVAWLIWLGTSVFGGVEFGVRIGAFCCAIVTSVFTYRLTRNLFGADRAWVAVLLIQVLPFFFLAGMLMTPDAPMTAAWAATLYFLERALIAGQGRAWLFAGVSLGLGLVSKYTIGMLAPAAFLFVLLDRQSRHWLLRWQPYAAAVIAAAIFSPVIIWNAQHDWASFAFQTSRRLAERPRFALHKLILSMLVLLTPTGFVTLLVSRFMGRGSNAAVAVSSELGSESAAEDSRRWLFLRLFVLVPIFVFAMFSLRHDVKIDWTGAPWVGAVPALAEAIISFGRKAVGGLRGWLYRAWAPTAVIMLLLYAIGLHYLALGLPGVGYAQHLELVPVGWRDLARQVAGIRHDLRDQTAREPIIVGMDRYELASELAFYLPDHARSVPGTSSRNLFGEEGLMYARWTRGVGTEDRPLVLVAWDLNDLSDAVTAPYVTSLGPIQTGFLSRSGTEIRDFHYRLARGLRPPPSGVLGTPK